MGVVKERSKMKEVTDAELIEVIRDIVKQTTIIGSRNYRIVFLDIEANPDGLWSFYENDIEEMVMKLYDLSLTHRIVKLDISERGRGMIDLYLEPSDDGTTNIDAELIDLLVRWLENRR